jgi:hypothetical protein
MSKLLKRKLINYSVYFLREDDEIIENSELEQVTKHKNKRSNDNTNDHYVLPNVSSFSNIRNSSKFIFYSLMK